MGVRFTWLASAFLLAMGLFGGQADAQANLIFRWVDAAGNLHVTDRLGDVPEPYYSAYAAELKRREELREKGKLAPPRPPPAESPEPGPTVAGPSLVDQEIQRRESWRREVANWRAELHGATEALVVIEAERAGAAQNPLLVHTPAVKQTLAMIDERRAAALVRLERARKMLLEDLPQRARRENVSPKWLE